MMKKWIFTILFVMLTGCVGNEISVETPICDDFDTTHSMAQFEVSEVEGAVEIIDAGSEGVLDSDFVLEFKACITDRLKIGGIKVTESEFDIYTFQPYIEGDDQRVRLNPFTIPTDEKQRRFATIRKTTDAEGCLYWSERYQFESPAEKKWIYFERVIENPTGRVTIPLIVNPWLEGSVQKIYDLNYNPWAGDDFGPFKMHEEQVLDSSSINWKADQCLQRRSLNYIFNYLEQDENKPILWADSIQIKSLYENISLPKNPSDAFYTKYSICGETKTKDCDQVGSFLRVGLNIPMKVLSKNYLNQVKENLLDRGVFLVTPYLTAYDAHKGDIMLHRSLPPITAEMTSASEPLKVPEFVVHIPYESSSHPIKLILKVEVKGREYPKPFYGAFTIAGEVESLHSEGRSINLDPSSAVLANGSSDPSDRFQQQIYRMEGFQEKFQILNKNNSYKRKKASSSIPGFYRSRLALDLKRMRFVRVDASGMCESVVNRTVVYLGEVCLKDPRRKINFNNQSFTVIAENLDLNVSPDLTSINIAQQGLRDSAEVFNAKYVYTYSGDDGQKQYFCYGKRMHPLAIHNLEKDKTGLYLCPAQNTLVDQQPTDHLGCIQFLYRLNHKPYDKQQYFAKRLIFKSTEYGYEDEQIVIVNPWEYGFLTYQDITQIIDRVDSHQKNAVISTLSNRRFQSSDIVNLHSIKGTALAQDVISLVSSRNLAPPILRLNEFRSIDIEPSYSIDHSLDISTVKNIIFLLQPKIYRSDSLANTIRAEPIVMPKGYWLVRFILAKGPQEMTIGKNRIMDSAMESSMKGMRDILNPISSLFSFYKNNQKADRFQRLITSSSFQGDTRFNAEEFFETLNPEDANNDCMAPNCFKFEKEDYISHFDTLAYSENGVLSAFMNQKFDVDQFRYMGSKNAIIFQIYPTDPAGYVTKGRTCDIDVNKSEFIPYKDHDLKTPAHWGLFQSSEFGNVIVVRPIGETRIQAFNDGLGPLGWSLPQTSSLDFQKLRKNVQILNEFGEIQGKEETKTDYQYKITETYDYIQNKGMEDYCTDVPKQSDQIMMSVDTSVEGLWFKMCVCRRPLSSFGLHDKIRQCLLKADFVDTFESIAENDRQGPVQLDNIRKKLDRDFIQTVEDVIHNNQAQIDKKIFCEQAFDSKKDVPNYFGEKDVSLSGQAYSECVCKDRSKDNLTKTLARCFAENENLVFPSSTGVFLRDLNKGVKFHKKSTARTSAEEIEFHYLPLKKYASDRHDDFTNKLQSLPPITEMKKDDLKKVIAEGFSKENIYKKEQGSFLHLMCHFWFRQYYPRYVKKEHIDHFYGTKKLSRDELKRLVSLYPDLAEEGSSVKDIVSDDYVFPEYADHALSSQPFSLKQTTEGHPYKNCVKNPLRFFHIERKTLVGQISDQNLKYKNGNVFIFNVGESAYKESRRDWQERQSFSLEGAVDVNTGVGKYIGVGARGSGKTTTSKDKSAGDAHRKSKTTSQNITLAVNHIEVDMPLKRYRQCLSIRPQRTAFKGYSRVWNKPLNDPFIRDREHLEFKRWPYRALGLLICNKESNTPMPVKENYYYVHQFFGGHAYEFMSRTIYHNRPYTAILRGKDQFEKFTFFIDAQFKYNDVHGRYYDPIKQSENLFLNDTANITGPSSRAFADTPLDKAGFYEGVYTHESELHFTRNLKNLPPSPKPLTPILDPLANWFLDATRVFFKERETGEED